MEENINDIINKFNKEILINLDIDNMKEIVKFLEDNNCNYINDIIEDYLDIFLIEYNIFVERFNHLNHKYNNKYLKMVSSDMNLLEEIFDEI